MLIHFFWKQLTGTGNIGNAKTAGLDTDLGLSDYQWSWVLYAFYICYIVFEWSTVLWKILPAHSYIAGLCIWQVSSPSTQLDQWLTVV